MIVWRFVPEQIGEALKVGDVIKPDLFIEDGKIVVATTPLMALQFATGDYILRLSVDMPDDSDGTVLLVQQAEVLNVELAWSFLGDLAVAYAASGIEYAPDEIQDRLTALTTAKYRYIYEGREHIMPLIELLREESAFFNQYHFGTLTSNKAPTYVSHLINSVMNACQVDDDWHNPWDGLKKTIIYLNRGLTLLHFVGESPNHIEMAEYENDLFSQISIDFSERVGVLMGVHIV